MVVVMAGRLLGSRREERGMRRFVIAVVLGSSLLSMTPIAGAYRTRPGRTASAIGARKVNAQKRALRQLRLAARGVGHDGVEVGHAIATPVSKIASPAAPKMPAAFKAET